MKASSSAEERMSGRGDDLQQRRAGAVQVHEGVIRAGRLRVQELAGVLFEVDVPDADALHGAGRRGCRDARRGRGCGSSARSGSSSAGRDSSSSCGRSSCGRPRCIRGRGRFSGRARRRGGSGPAARRAARGRPGRSASSAARRSASGSRRRAWSRWRVPRGPRCR